MPNFERNRGTKTIFGNWEHKKTNIRFSENRGTSQFLSGEQGNRYPPGRASQLTNSSRIIVITKRKDEDCVLGFTGIYIIFLFLL